MNYLTNEAGVPIKASNPLAVGTAENIVLSATLQSSATALGNGTAIDLEGKYGLLTLQVSGITSATVTFEATIDDTNWVAVRGINKNTGSGATSTTADGIFTFAVGGYSQFRARISTYASGTIVITANAIAASEPSNQATTTTGTISIDQATPGSTNKVVAAIDQTTDETTNRVVAKISQVAGENTVSLSGSYVEIGGVSFAVSGGDTIRNTAANKPDAAAAHAVIPFCYYFSVDTGIVEVTDGTNWVVI